MDDLKPGSTTLANSVTEQTQRTVDEVNEAFERIRVQLMACWGPEPMARVAT